jgi:hypothetical protein
VPYDKDRKQLVFCQLKKRRYDVKISLTYNAHYIITVCMNTQSRLPKTFRMSRQAIEELWSMYGLLLHKSGGEKVRDVSPGKIIEALLLKEDAQSYVEKKLLHE